MNHAVSDLVLQLIGVVNGVRPYDWLHRLESMQYWGPGEVAAFQRRELAATLTHAVENVPYYGDVLRGVDLARAAEAPEGLRDLPTLSKETLRERFDDLQSAAHVRGGVQDISTSGSTGAPLRILIDNEAFGRCFAAKFRALRWYGVNFADRQLRVWGRMMRKDQELYWRLRDLLQNRRRMVSFDLSDDTLAREFTRMQEFRPVYVNGYTSAIQRFADFIESTGREGRSLGAKLVVPTAEMLYDWQRDQMRRVFGCPVMNEYGGCEITAMAYECPSGFLHLSHENWVVEVLDEKGESVPDGQEGLLTATSLCFRALPLIRYQNGDVVVKQSGLACGCGRHQGLPYLVRVVGRSTDVLLRADGQPTHWTTMYYAIKDALEPGMVLEHQARQTAVDRIEILVVRGPRYTDVAMQRFLRRMREVLGEAMRLEVKFVDAIPREKSGKHRYFVSDVERARLDVAQPPRVG